MKGHPSTWKPVHYANIGTSELFVHRLINEIPKLVDASTIYDPQRAETKYAITHLVLDGFMPAFEHLRKIRTLAVDRPPELNRRQTYEDFMRTLWHAYKDLLPKAAREMGFEIGFLFQAAPKFAIGLARFVEGNPEIVESFGDYLREQRTEWQDNLARVRNDYLEHRKLDWQDVSFAYYPGQAEAFFTRAWTAASDILVVLIVSKFPPMFGLEEIPVSERAPEHPDRFRFVLLKPKQ